MINREKVIKGLEYCTSNDGCKNCPYNPTEGVCGYTCLQDALALLKEQEERVEPIAIKREMFDPFHRSVAWCPKCDCLWIMYIDENMHYCPECGQAVKWE